MTKSWRQEKNAAFFESQEKALFEGKNRPEISRFFVYVEGQPEPPFSI
jgi:hypothetical protein